MPPRHDRHHDLARSIARATVTAARKSEDLEMDSLDEPDTHEAANLRRQADRLAGISKTLHVLFTRIQPKINANESHVPSAVTLRQIRQGGITIWKSENRDSNTKR